jgi:hypothetical protein
MSKETGASSVLVTVRRQRGKELAGAVIIDTAKGTEPKTDDAAARLTEAMTHAAYLLHEHVANTVSETNQQRHRRSIA